MPHTYVCMYIHTLYVCMCMRVSVCVCVCVLSVCIYVYNIYVWHTSDNGFIRYNLPCSLFDHLLQHAAIFGLCDVLHLKCHQFKGSLKYTQSTNSVNSTVLHKNKKYSGKNSYAHIEASSIWKVLTHYDIIQWKLKYVHAMHTIEWE